jgi:hypothetical protein
MILSQKFLKIQQLYKQYQDMPRVTVDLMNTAVEQIDPDYSKFVKEFYDAANTRHPKYLIFKMNEIGMTLCHLPKTGEEYFASIESSARRNHKKAVREGCTFKRLIYNNHLKELGAIWKSTPDRQGKAMSAEFDVEEAPFNTNPEPKTNTHLYPSYGIFLNGQLIAHADCFIAGEIAIVQRIFGHADFSDYRPVPQLFIEVAMELIKNHPSVKYFSYGMYFGASESMQRFKRKFGFLPHKVTWKLG